MQLSFAAPTTIGPGALVVGATEGSKLLPAAAAADKEAGGALTRALGFSRFTGKSGQMLEILAPAGVKASRIVVIGLGTGSDVNRGQVETAAAAAIGRLGTAGESEVTFHIDVPKGSKLKQAALAAHIALGARLKTYTFNHYRTKNRDEHEQRLKTVRVVTDDTAAAKRAFAPLDAIATGMFLARDLVNEPPNVLSPVEFARRVKSNLAKAGVKVSVLGEAEMKKLGMGALLGVGQGSERESQLVVMQWNGGRKKDQPVAFVGKGVCFDSGGLSLKSGAGMMGMKGDMGGAAAVAGTLLSLALRRARVNAVGVVGLVENMPDGKAQRPDDVVKSMSGQTIEVLNTDAEGRLVLADGLFYARELGCTHLIDAATLTGACVVALGMINVGVFSNNEEIYGKFSEALERSGEKMWRLPVEDEYREMIKSGIADIVNSGGRWGGAITAAMFLKEFVDETPWIHLDIAGCAWMEESKPWIAKGPSGVAVRSLVEFVKAYSA